VHTKNGCRAGRYHLCHCLLDPRSVIETATVAVRVPQWNEAHEAAKGNARRPASEL